MSFHQRKLNKLNKKEHDRDNDQRILEVKMVQTAAFKQVIERISHVITDCCIVFIRADNEPSYENEYEETEFDNVEITNIKQQKKKSKKIINDGDSDNDDSKSKKKKIIDENSDNDNLKSKKNKSTKLTEGKKSNKSKKIIDENSDSDNFKSKETKESTKISEDKTSDKSKNKTLISSIVEKTKKITQKKNTGGIRILRLTEEQDVLVKLTLEADKFEYFRCDEPKITIGVDMHAFIAHLKMISDDDPLVMYMNKDNRSSLFILATGAENNEETDIEFSLIDIPNQEYPIPKTVFQNKITIAQDKFHQICKNLNSNASHIEIRSVNDQMSFTGRSENGKVTMTYKDKDYKHNKEYGKEELVFQGIYELKNLMYFSKCNKICSTIDLYLKNDFPLVLVIEVGSLGKMYVFMMPGNPENNI